MEKKKREEGNKMSILSVKIGDKTYYLDEDWYLYFVDEKGMHVYSNSVTRIGIDFGVGIK